MMCLRGTAMLAAAMAAGLMASPVMAIDDAASGPPVTTEPLPAVVRVYEPGFIVDGDRVWAYTPPARRGYPGRYEGLDGFAPRAYRNWRPRPYSGNGGAWPRYNWSGSPGYRRYGSSSQLRREPRYGYAAPRYAEVAPWQWRTWGWPPDRPPQWHPYWRPY